MNPAIIIILVILIPVASAIGFYIGSKQVNGALNAEALARRDEAERIVLEAKNQQKDILLAAKDEAARLKETTKNAQEAENRERRGEIQRQERRIQKKEEDLDRKTDAYEKRERGLNQREKEIEAMRAEAEGAHKTIRAEVERVANLTTAEAKKELLAQVEDEVRGEANKRVRQVEEETKERADELAREIITIAMQRVASDQVSESTVSVVPLPNEEMKGRIIGREGRNIRALENATGVDLIIDDTPEAVILSGFDPVRREVARLSLNKLIVDGRIHPARIEEVVNKSRHEVEAIIREEGEKASMEVGIPAVAPELAKLLGRLKYRMSYGQNVLNHSKEVALLAGIIAAELGGDVMIAKTAGLLHDIGKAVDHEVEGPHAVIGAEIVKRYHKSLRVAAAVGAHHNDDGQPMTLDTALVIAADAMSAARPGARRETLDLYIKRLEALESIANSFPGVERSFAIQAGREVRILVKPESVDDLGAVRLARDVSKKIEESLQYPGQIKIMVVRETRVVDFAK